MKLIDTMIEELSSVGKWQQSFFKVIVGGFLGVTGKLNFRNISRYILLHEKTIARNFGKFFPFLEMNVRLVQEAGEECSTIAFDPLFIPKAGKTTEGQGLFWNGSEGRVARGIEFALIAIVNVVKNISYPLHAQQTRTDVKQESESRIDLYIRHIARVVTELGKSFGITVKYILVDSFFYKEKFVHSMRSLGLHVVSKMRIDARLRHIYEGPQKSRGRHKKYAAAVAWDDLSLFELVKSEADPDLVLYTAVVNSIVLGLQVRVVYLVKTINGKDMRAIIYSTDTTLSALAILGHYRARFQIEFLIRDAKQHAGLADCQSVVAQRLDFHVNTSFTTVNVAKVTDAQHQSDHDQRPHFSMLNHKIRSHNQLLLERIFSMLDLDLLHLKSSALYSHILNIGTVT